MKQIITGKMYNTDTATKVGEWWNGCSTSDFQYCEETLYRKRTGEYFLHGEGGPMSGYAKSCGQNSWGYGEDIVPVTEMEAKEWAERKLNADEYIEAFGEPEE